MLDGSEQAADYAADQIHFKWLKKTRTGEITER